MSEKSSAQELFLLYNVLTPVNYVQRIYRLSLNDLKSDFNHILTHPCTPPEEGTIYLPSCSEGMPAARGD